MKIITTLDVLIKGADGELVSLDSLLWAVQDKINAKNYEAAIDDLAALRTADLNLASEASGAIHFNKALLVSKKPSKQDPSKFFHDFYIQVKPDSTPVAIKIAFYSPAVFKYLLANADKVQAYVKKSVEVQPVEKNGFPI